LTLLNPRCTWPTPICFPHVLLIFHPSSVFLGCKFFFFRFFGNFGCGEDMLQLVTTNILPAENSWFLRQAFQRSPQRWPEALQLLGYMRRRRGIVGSISGGKIHRFHQNGNDMDFTR
jgi:hypothetical protein